MAVYADPTTKKHVGIICDICGTIHRDKFTYYSAKVDMVEVDSEIQKTGVLNVDRRYLDIDYCQLCFEKVKQQIIDASQKKQKQGNESWTTTTKK